MSRRHPGHSYFAGAPLLIAHRGGAALAPENTLLAFRRAIDWWRADILELDVQPTRDGEAVVIHDPTVDRTTDGTGRVADLELAEIRRFDAGYRFTPDHGRTFPFRARGERIPTLHEVLSTLPDIRVNVEIKDPRAQKRVWEIVHDLGASRRVLIAGERRRNRSAFGAYVGPVSAAREDLYAFLALLRLGAARYFPVAVDAFQMPERHAGRQVLTPDWVERAQALNIPVHIWTVNEADDMTRLLRWGVDGIISDRPDVLARVLHDLAGRPLPPGPPPGEAEPFMERLLLR